MTDVVSNKKSKIAVETSVQTAKLSGNTSVDLGEISGWSDMARALAIPIFEPSDFNLFQFVSKYFRNEAHGKWLLLLDNADDDVVITSPGNPQLQTEQQTNILEECLPPKK